MLSISRFLACAALFGLGRCALGQQVWVVDDQPGPGVAFTELQPAIDAASAGDVVLVKDGRYKDFALDGKGLAIEAELGASVVIGSSTSVSSVRHVPLAQTCVLRGLSFRNKSSITELARLSIEQCAGPVWVEDCDSTSNPNNGPTKPDGARVVDSASVVLERCAFTAPGGGFFLAFQSGLACSGSNVHMHGTQCIGGAGPMGQPGAHGLTLTGGTLDASGCTVLGGKGGDNSPQTFAHCTQPGVGGNGLVVKSDAIARTLDTAPLGGLGGQAACETAAPGAAIVVSAGAVDPLPGAARTLDSSSPAREGEVLTLTFGAQDGDLVFYGFSATTNGAWLPGLYGPLLLGDPIAVKFVGAQSGSSPLTTGFVVPDLGGDVARHVRYQCGVLDTSGAIRIGGATNVLLLDASL